MSYVTGVTEAAVLLIFYVQVLGADQRRLADLGPSDLFNLTNSLAEFGGLVYARRTFVGGFRPRCTGRRG